MSRVDIIIPCYKYADYLTGCVRSVLSQSHTDLRVLIIDDASPDHTAEVAAGLVAEDHRVEFLRHTSNQGHIITYNEGLAWADGDYTLLVSADDLLTPGALERVVRLLDAHPEVGLAYGRQIAFQTEPPPFPSEASGSECASRVLTGAEFIENCCAVGSNPVATPTAVVRTALLKELGGYRRDLPHTADMELWLRLAVHGSVGILEADQAYKRFHSNNMQHQYLDVPVDDMRQRKAAFEIVFGDFRDRIPDASRLEQLAARSIASEAFWAASSAFDRGDMPRCRMCLDFALKVDPALRSRPEWLRFSLKRCVGPKVWGGVQSVAARYRSKTDPRRVPTSTGK